MTHLLKNLRHRLAIEVNYLFFRRYRFARTVRRHLLKYYSPAAPKAYNERKWVVFMADGKRHHGGLVDRLRSMTSIFKYCKDEGLDFKINFVEPFHLEKYLMPNHYDWLISPEQVSYNSHDSRPVYMTTSSKCGSHERERRYQLSVTRAMLSKNYKQIHVYCQAFDFNEDYFAEMFDYLFKPTPMVEEALALHLKALGGVGNYLSVSSRFLELLGDFKEPKAVKTLAPDEQTKLMEACISQIERIHEQHPDVRRILVTSDSSRFLKACGRLPYAYVIPGEIAHMDVHGTDGNDQHLKTFVDFLAIARARKSFLLLTGDMYRSSFALRAAQIGFHDFSVVSF